MYQQEIIELPEGAPIPAFASGLFDDSQVIGVCDPDLGFEIAEDLGKGGAWRGFTLPAPRAVLYLNSSCGWDLPQRRVDGRSLDWVRHRDSQYYEADPIGSERYRDFADGIADLAEPPGAVLLDVDDIPARPLGVHGFPWPCVTLLCGLTWREPACTSHLWSDPEGVCIAFPNAPVIRLYSRRIPIEGGPSYAA